MPGQFEGSLPSKANRWPVKYLPGPNREAAVFVFRAFVVHLRECTPETKNSRLIPCKNSDRINTKKRSFSNQHVFQWFFLLFGVKSEQNSPPVHRTSDIASKSLDSLGKHSWLREPRCFLGVAEKVIEHSPGSAVFCEEFLSFTKIKE